jgi:hypothetical protein
MCFQGALWLSVALFVLFISFRAILLCSGCCGAAKWSVDLFQQVLCSSMLTITGGPGIAVPNLFGQFDFSILHVLVTFVTVGSVSKLDP